ncbi:MAG: winged helix-turn-helix domain-containing protein [Methanomicrobiales archaeon]|jgi:DNA-binding transcriptional ArsR family regulator|nr:winged helix-turn-helix domain-containing protein [Methanomicrobiales archaeon]
MPTTNLPPSSKKLFQLFEEGRGMTYKDLVSRSGLPPRTVRYALKKLKDRGLVAEKFNFQDARQIIYLKRPQAAATAS